MMLWFNGGVTGGMCCIRAPKWRINPVLGVWVPHQSHTFFLGRIWVLGCPHQGWELGQIIESLTQASSVPLPQRAGSGQLHHIQHRDWPGGGCTRSPCPWPHQSPRGPRRLPVGSRAALLWALCWGRLPEHHIPTVLCSGSAPSIEF